MKQQLIRITGISCLLLFAVMAAAGTWSANKFFYQPALDARGSTEKNNFDTGLNQVDAHLGNYKTSGDPNYSTLAEALTTMGTSTPATLTIPAGTVPVPTSITIPANVIMHVLSGGKFDVAPGATLTINSAIEAGPYQIFSWTGTGSIDLKKSPTTRCYFQWWGAQDEPYSSTFDAHDNGPALQKAYDSLYGHQEIYFTKGIWRITTPVVVLSPEHPASLVGEDTHLSTIYVDVGPNNIGLDMGKYGKIPQDFHQILGCWIKDISFAVKKDGAKHAVRLDNWNAYGGMKRVDFYGGSTDFIVKISAMENCNIDISLGTNHNSYVFTSGLEPLLGRAKKGVGLMPGSAPGQGAGGTYNQLRLLTTFACSGTQALYAEQAWDWEILQSDIENIFAGEGPWNMNGWAAGEHPPGTPVGIALHSGGTTKAAETFTLTEETLIENVGMYFATLGSARGFYTIKLFNTSGGVPSTLIATSLTQNDGMKLNPGGTNTVHFPFVFQFHQTLAAGTYAVVAEYTGGDVSNYVSVNRDTSGVNDYDGTCYTYDGSWHPQTYHLRFAINPKHAMEFYKCSQIKINHIHFESNWEDLHLDYCEEFDINDMGGMVFRIDRSEKIRFGGTSYIRELHIDPISQITLGNFNLFGGVLEDYGNTLYLGDISSGGGVFRPVPDIKGNNFTNYCPNTLFDRWQSDRPDGWEKDNNTWTKCGTGISPPNDIRHNAPYCAKIINSGNPSSIYLSAFSNFLDLLKGNYINFSAWVMFPAGQNWAAASGHFQAYYNVPDWANTTAYKVGETINTASGNFICVVAGTSGDSTPNWAGVSGKGYIWDGTVKWVNATYTIASNWQITGGSPDVTWSDGVWRRLGLSLYIPPNATGIAMFFWCPTQSPSGNTTVYIAEPTLGIGPIPPRGIQPSLNEFKDSITIGGQKITFGSTSQGTPTGWRKRGDQHWWTDPSANGSPGSIAIADGAPATWKAMPNLVQ